LYYRKSKVSKNFLNPGGTKGQEGRERTMLGLFSHGVVRCSGLCHESAILTISPDLAPFFLQKPENKAKA
jgi:hypothetical protein